MYAVARFYGYMRDSEVVAAIVAGDPDGLAEAYDRYAAPLYAYCRSLLREPADAADAVQDTFVIAASKLAGLRDRNRLRPWLYAVARNECHRRLREGANEAPSALDAVPDVTDESADVTGGAERAELRTLLRSAVRGLNAGEQDLIELQLRQELDVAEIAAVLGISRNHAHALLSRARDQLEISLGALLVARSGRADCAALGALLEDWDGQLNVLMRKRINRHIERCPACAERKRRELAPALLLGLAPLAALPVAVRGSMPAGLRAQILRLASSNTPEAMAHRASVVQRTAPFGEHGFPKPLDPPPWWRERRGQAIAAAAVIIATAAALTGLALAGGLSAQPGRPSALSQASGPGGSAAAAAGTTLGAQASSPGPSARPTGPARGAARVSPSPAVGSLPVPAAATSPPAPAPAPPAHHSTSPGPSASPATTPAASSTAASSTAASTAASSTAASTASSAPTPTFTLIPGTLRVTPTTIVLSPPLGGTLTLTASGGPVTWSITESSALIGEVTVSPSSGRLAAGQSATVSVGASGTVSGQSVAAALGTVSAVSVDGRLAVNPGGITVTVVIDLGSQSPGSPSPSSPSPSSPSPSSPSPSSPSPSSPSQSIPPADALGPARLVN